MIVMKVRSMIYLYCKLNLISQGILLISKLPYVLLAITHLIVLIKIASGANASVLEHLWFCSVFFISLLAIASWYKKEEYEV